MAVFSASSVMLTFALSLARSSGMPECVVTGLIGRSYGSRFFRLVIQFPAGGCPVPIRLIGATAHIHVDPAMGCQSSILGGMHGS
jgi:hypothetical protein